MLGEPRRRAMGKIYAGVAQTSKCWTCLDEFNRISIEVLSVIAQQTHPHHPPRAAARRYLSLRLQVCSEIPLKPSAAVFITMNPGLRRPHRAAGQPEGALPAVRAMMVPDYALIAEIMLYAEGFLDARLLAQKMVKMYSSAPSSSASRTTTTSACAP